ncbi:hypothetical protein ACTXT7_001943 [Hymenolepis weldensis]
MASTIRLTIKQADAQLLECASGKDKDVLYIGYLKEKIVFFLQNGSEFSEPYTPTSDDYSIDTAENDSTDGDIGVGNGSTRIFGVFLTENEEE